MAEKKKAPVERKFVDASEGKTKETASGSSAVQTKKSKAAPFRIAAIILWVLAIAAEVLVILYLNGTLYIEYDPTIVLIVGLGIDFVLAIVAALLWKKANRVNPPSKADKTKFFLQSQLGLIMTIIAFLPLVIILLKNKDLDGKTKKIASILAIVLLIVASLVSVDFNPPSAEDLQSANDASVVLGDGTAYWTRWGKSYHFDPNCQTLMNSEVVFHGTVDEAFEANRTDPCDFCALEQ